MKKLDQVFSQTQRRQIITMIEGVVSDPSYSVTRTIKGYKVTAKSVPNSQRCLLSIVDTDKSKFRNV